MLSWCVNSGNYRETHANTYSWDNIVWGWEEKVIVKTLPSINFQGLCVGTEKNKIKSVRFIKQDERKRENCFLQEIKKVTVPKFLAL